MKKNKLNTFFIALFFVASLMSCKNEKLPVLDIKSNDVQFYATGSYLSDNIKIEAGVNKYYMNSSFHTDSQLYILNSKLAQINCSLCENSIEISVSNSNTYSSTSSFDINSVFYVGKKFDLFFDSLGRSMDTSQAIITIKDPLTAKHYSSLHYQPANFLEITGVESYSELNNSGQKTVKVSFTSQCLLKSDSTPPSLVSLNGVFAFAYPTP